MTDLENEILKSLDGTDPELFPFLPYLLQDLWDLGTPVEILIHLIKKHNILKPESLVLDLGCGKGAASVSIAKEFGVSVTGIDGMKEFIAEAEKWAIKFQVSRLCTFKVGDIREILLKKNYFNNAHLIILGAVTPFSSDYQKTFSCLYEFMQPGSRLITDIGYTEDKQEFTDERFPIYSELQKIILGSGLKLEEEFSDDLTEDLSGRYTGSIRKRAEELKLKFPSRQYLFDEYVRIQEEESYILENKVSNKILLLKK